MTTETETLEVLTFTLSPRATVSVRPDITVRIEGEAPRAT